MERNEKASSWGMTLEEYVLHLLKLGKKRDAEEFQTLIEVYGIRRIEEIVNRIRERLREERKAKGAKDE